MADFPLTNGNDTLTGTQDADLFAGDGGGDDLLDGLGGDDRFVLADGAMGVVHGGDGIDTIQAGGSLAKLEFDGIEVIAFEIMDMDGVSSGNRIRLDQLAGTLALLPPDAAPGLVIRLVGPGGALELGQITVDPAITTMFLGSELDGALDARGSDGRDWVRGSVLGDTLSGLAGDDELAGGAGDDTLSGGDGNDVLYAEAGRDRLEGGAGDDQLIGEGLDTLVGGDGNDGLVGGSTDVIDAGAGDDVVSLGIMAIGGAATVFDGGDGIDRANLRGDISLIEFHNFEQATAFFDLTATLANLASFASIELYPSAFSIELVGEGGQLVMPALTTFSPGPITVDISGESLTSGLDLKLGNYASSVVATGLNDTITAGGGDDSLIGGHGDDRLWGSAGNDTVRGGAGNDMLGGLHGLDRLIGGSGNDTYLVRGSDNGGMAAIVVELKGGGSDTIVTSSEIGPLTDYVENLTLRTLEGTRISGYGNDLDNVVRGGAGGESVNGLAGDDTLVGNDGDDDLYGGAGRDRLIGGTGNDTLWGGLGADTARGGAGYDVFRFEALDRGPCDTIADFVSGEDVIELYRDAFPGLTAATLHVGSAPADGTLLLFDPGTHTLYFTPAGDRIAIARLSGVETLAVSDFSIL